MKHIIILIIAAALLSGSAPAPVAAPAAACWPGVPAVYVAGQAPCWRGVPYTLPVEIRGVVEGSYRGGLTGPIGEYTAYGASLGEATANAQQLERNIRMTATAQAIPQQ